MYIVHVVAAVKATFKMQRVLKVQTCMQMCSELKRACVHVFFPIYTGLCENTAAYINIHLCVNWFRICFAMHDLQLFQAQRTIVDNIY